MTIAKLTRYILLIAISYCSATAQDVQKADQWAIDLTRAIGKDIFENNGVPFMQPVVVAMNATSNSRFFNTAYVSTDNDNPYIKFSVNTMTGFVRDDMRTYKPSIPTKEFQYEDLLKYGSINLQNQTFAINDTAGLIHYMFQNLLYDGIDGKSKGAIKIPESAATLLGSQKAVLDIPAGKMEELAKGHPIYKYLDSTTRQQVLDAMGDIPDYFTLPPGANKSVLFAIIPQIEIGAFYGTEILIRYIPPVEIDKDIGKFSFWGLLLKHNISQYFPEKYFDLAIQGGFQGTTLTNEVGITQAKFESNANLFNFNIHASKSFEGILDIYTGLSFEQINIDTRFQYFIPVEQQQQLGLLDIGAYINDPDNPDYRPAQTKPTPGYPGDQKPQTAKLGLSDTNIKWIVGIKKDFANFSIFADYSISKFNILSAGMEYRFNVFYE